MSPWWNEKKKGKQEWMSLITFLFHVRYIFFHIAGMEKQGGITLLMCQLSPSLFSKSLLTSQFLHLSYANDLQWSSSPFLLVFTSLMNDHLLFLSQCVIYLLFPACQWITSFSCLSSRPWILSCYPSNPSWLDRYLVSLQETSYSICCCVLRFRSFLLVVDWFVVVWFSHKLWSAFAMYKQKTCLCWSDFPNYWRVIKCLSVSYTCMFNISFSLSRKSR